MARRRRSSVTTRKSGNTEIVVVEPQRTAPIERTRKSRRRGRSRIGANRSMAKNTMIGAGLGGLAYGFVEKTFPSMPSMPIIGRSGTVALACYMFGGQNRIIADIGIAAAVIAGYSLAKDGVISGDGDDYDHGLSTEA